MRCFPEAVFQGSGATGNDLRYLKARIGYCSSENRWMGLFGGRLFPSAVSGGPECGPPVRLNPVRQPRTGAGGRISPVIGLIGSRQHLSKCWPIGDRHTVPVPGAGDRTGAVFGRGVSGWQDHRVFVHEHSHRFGWHVRIPSIFHRVPLQGACQPMPSTAERIAVDAPSIPTHRFNNTFTIKAHASSPGRRPAQGHVAAAQAAGISTGGAQSGKFCRRVDSAA